MTFEVCSFSRRAMRVAAILVFLSPAAALGQSAVTEKLDPVAQALSRQLTGRSRVIVQFHGEPDVRVITSRRGVAGRQLAEGDAQVADINNTELATVAASPNVRRIAIDHPAFGTLERTGAALGATLAR